MEHAGDPGGIIGRVRLEFTASQALFKSHLPVQPLINGIGLVSVCDDRLVAEHTDGSVDDQAGILHFRGIKSLCADPVSFSHKDPVAAVSASAHDEIGDDCFFSVSTSADHNASSRITHFSQNLFQICHGFFLFLSIWLMFCCFNHFPILPNLFYKR